MSQRGFVDEHLIRDACITVGQAASVDGPCSGVGGGTTTTTTTTTIRHVPAPARPARPTHVRHDHDDQRASAPAEQPHGQVAKATVRGLGAARADQEGRVLMVKIHSAKKTAKIQIRLVNAKGKVISVLVRTVKTNKRVAVSNLRISPSVKTVRVKVLS